MLTTTAKKRGDKFEYSRNLAVSIILLGLLHVLIYALAMPPWGLLDESQHFHYIQVIAEEQRLPVMWQDQLSEEIIDSIFAVKRYITLGGSHMPDRAEIMAPGRLDSQSYEAYHPPLYYALLALIYPFGPTDVLGKLFVLRLAGAVLSCLTLLIVWKSTRLLWPDQTWIAGVATLFVALHPERASSMGQLNNDILLEVTCAAAFGLLAWAMVRGTNWRLALALGLLLGLAVVTKLSALIIIPALILGWILSALAQHQPWRTAAGQILIILGSVVAFLLPLVGRNLLLYQEPTGLEAFIAHIGPLTKGSLAELIAIGLVDLFRNSWAILWEGDKVVGKPSAALLQLALVGITSGLGVGLIRAWQRQDPEMMPLTKTIILVSGLAILLVGISTLMSYVRGLVPVVQGRFLLPALVPTAWLIGFSLWRLGVRWRSLMASLLLLLEIALGMSVLFFHSLPKFYAPRDTGFLGYWPQTIYLLFNPAGMFWDKPAFVNIWIFGLLILAFCGCAISVGILLLKQFGSPIRRDQLTTLLTLVNSAALVPTTSSVNKEGNNPASWTTHFRRAVRDPLLWTTCLLLIIYLGWVSFYPPNIFWSLDEGGKYIHLQSIIESGNPGAPLLYPGRYLDQKLNFVPLFFWARQDDQVYSWWPVGFQLITLPFYLLFGWFGLYLLPALSGAASALFAGLLIRHLQPQGRWLAAGATIITGLATPIAFYSTLFWEHTLSVACFLGGLLLILQAWQTGRALWIVIAGILLGLATYLRTDIAAMVAGIGLVLLILYWRWAILLGISYISTSLLWLLSNSLLMGHFLGRYWIQETANSGARSLGSGLFLGFQEAGIWFIPYALFNAPRIVALPLESGILALATLLTVIVLVAPLSSHWTWLALLGYASLSLICAWVLFQANGYRSVHGFVLIAPHVVFAAWLYRSRPVWRRALLPLLLLGIVTTYALSYLTRGWVAAGGLQWGPRYWLAFYPLLVAASLAGLATAWPSLSRTVQLSLLTLYSLCLLIGFGYQVRGAYALMETKKYYQQTEQAIRQLNAETIVTSCSWLSMVIPDLYLSGSVFTVSDDATFENWVAEARRAGIHSVCRVEMDLCQLTPLDTISAQRATNPGGIETQCFAE